MTAEHQSHHLTKETSPSSSLHPYWLAGFLEMTGTITLTTVKGRQVPRITISGTSDDITILRGKIQDTLGLTPYNRVHPPEFRKLGISGESARRLLSLVPPEYMPGKAKLIQAILSGDAQKVEEARNRTLPLFPEGNNPYEELVTKPEFLAGILDARKPFRRRYASKERDIPVIRINSTNRNIISALQTMHQGLVRPHNSGQVEFISQKAKEIYELVKPHLLLRNRQAEEIFAKTSVEIPFEKERQEFVHEHAQYLAGFFEVGGSICIGRVTKRGNEILTPIIKLHGKLDKIAAWDEFMEIFHPLYQERQKKDGTIMYSSQIHGKRALTILTAVMPLMHTRSTLRDFLLHDWNTLSPHQERSARYQEVKNQPDNKPTSKDYEALVIDPEFVAGILDSRGIFRIKTRTRRENSKIKFPLLNVRTTNIGLLHALKEQYGGSIAHAKYGDYTSYEWSIQSDALVRLYQMTKDHLKIVKERAEEVMTGASLDGSHQFQKGPTPPEIDEETARKVFGDVFGNDTFE